MRREGAEGIVLDLRANGGGLLGEAVRAPSIFLPEGRSRGDDRTRAPRATPSTRPTAANLPPKPLVVLIDRNTASAAEILTAALADDAGAPVVGTHSYGKGVFQQEFDLSNGGALKLTSANTSRPTGSTWRNRTGSTRTSRSATTRHEPRRGARPRSAGAGRRSGPRRAGMSPRGPRRSRARRRRTPATRSRRCCGRSSAGAAFRAGVETRRARAAGARPRSAPCRAAISSSCRPSPSTRRRRATSTTPSRRAARGTASGSGSTSPTSPPTSSPARRWTSRRGGAANSTYAPGTVEPMLPHALSEDACSLAPGVERLAVTAEVELGGAGSAGRGGFYRSRIRSDARLDYDQLDLVFAGRGGAAGAGRRSRSRSPGRWPRRSASAAARPASTSSPSSPSSASTPAAT